MGNNLFFRIIHDVAVSLVGWFTLANNNKKTNTTKPPPKTLEQNKKKMEAMQLFAYKCCIFIDMQQCDALQLEAF